MENCSEEQRANIRQLVHEVLSRDMATFNADRFNRWIEEMDACFRKVGLALRFQFHNRSVLFTIKEISGGSTVFRFVSPSRVRFDYKKLSGSATSLAQPTQALR